MPYYLLVLRAQHCGVHAAAAHAEARQLSQLALELVLWRGPADEAGGGLAGSRAELNCRESVWSNRGDGCVHGLSLAESETTRARCAADGTYRNASVRPEGHDRRQFRRAAPGGR